MYRMTVVAVLVVFCLSATANAAGVVTITTGTVIVEKDGTVLVEVGTDESKEVFIPSNGRGLWRSGQIDNGDEVGVRIVRDRGRRHGHVTVLK